MADAGQTRWLQLPAMAENAKTQSARDRRYTVFAIVKCSILPQRMFNGKMLRLGRGVRPRMAARHCTVSQAFLNGYGDESGAEYWRAWIEATDADPDEKIALLLATHVAAEKEGRIGKDRGNSFDWRARSEIQSRVKERCKTALAAIAKRNWSLRKRIDEMAADPNNEDLIPPSLRTFLTPPIIAAKPATPDAAISAAGLRPMSDAKKREVQQFLVHQRHSSDDEAWQAARAKFAGFAITRKLIRGVRRKANLKGKVGRRPRQKSRA